jgi:hypothetical protein
MTTAEASVWLGEALAMGCDGRTEQEQQAIDAIRVAYQAGTEWSWKRAEKAIARAYAALGVPADPDATGYAWHAGETAIQAAFRAWMD